eukprot:COSAG01_NODE_1404_length_10443_cov_29.217517_1_plen_341_part_10
MQAFNPADIETIFAMIRALPNDGFVTINTTLKDALRGWVAETAREAVEARPAAARTLDDWRMAASFAALLIEQLWQGTEATRLILEALREGAGLEAVLDSDGDPTGVFTERPGDGYVLRNESEGEAVALELQYWLPLCAGMSHEDRLALYMRVAKAHERRLAAAPTRRDEVGKFRARAKVAQLTALCLERPEEGRRLFEALLPPMDAALGTAHAAAMNARNNYAVTLAQVGDREGANAQYRRVIAASTQARGAAHPETLAYRGSLAVGLAQTGETEAAGREREAVLAGNTVQLGADHKDTLESKRELAYHHKNHLGDAAAGVALLREVVAACERNPELGRE